MHTKIQLNRRLRLVAISTLCTLLAGCSFGPVVLKSSRSEYNRAVHQSSNEEILLNMIRLRYKEPMQFLQIGNITSQYSFTQNLNLNGKIPGNGANVLTAIGGFGRSEKPTISYKPMEGKQFVSRFLEETSVNTFLLLIRAGWNIERLARILVGTIGGLYNAPNHPSYSKYIELMQIWDQLHGRGDLAFTYLPGKEKIISGSIPENQVNIESLVLTEEAGLLLKANSNGRYQLTKKGKPILVMKLTFRNQTEADRVDALLGTQAERTTTADGGIIEYIQFTDPLLTPDSGTNKSGSIAKVPLVLRSFGNQLYEMAKSIELPDKDKARAKTYVNAHGETADRRMAFKDLLDIRTSASKPDNALVRVQYRDAWFFIDRDDSSSMATFSLLKWLFSLQAGEEEAGPVLTIPVGG